MKSFCFLKEQVSKNHLPTRKRNGSMLMSFRLVFQAMDERVTASLEVRGEFELESYGH